MRSDCNTCYNKVYDFDGSTSSKEGPDKDPFFFTYGFGIIKGDDVTDTVCIETTT